MGVAEFLGLIGSMENMLSPADAGAVQAWLQQYIERGELGEKCGKGVYTYPNPQYQQEGFLQDS
jgi:3-hydroxyacyl-CoA dehydrogenase